MNWFYAQFRKPILWIIGEKCTAVLLDQLNLFDSVCLKYALIKGLGIGLVLGGSMVKLPQIYKVLKLRSTFGISMASVVLECVANIVTFSYNFSNHNPFSTYGESLFIGIQNLLLIIIINSINRTSATKLVLSLCLFCAVLSNRYTCPTSLLVILQLCSVPIMVSSRLSQIWTNHKYKSTGQLAAFTIFANFIGTFARVITTVAEINDPQLLLTSIINATVNGILAYQMLIYWQPSNHHQRSGINALAGSSRYD